MNPVDVDIEEILEDVARVLKERETGHSQAYHSEVREVEDLIYLLPGAWENIAQSLISVDHSMALLPGQKDGSESGARRKVIDPLKGVVKKFIRKSVYWYVNPVVAQLHGFHGNTVRALHEIVDQLRNINARLEIIERENLVNRVSSFESERFDQRVGRLERSWRQYVADGPRPPADAGAGEAGRMPLIEVESQEVSLVGKDRVKMPEAETGSAPMFHFDYYWFEGIHRGDRELVKKRQKQYLEYFEGCTNVLDIGSGKGEFLELMKEKGIGGYGIDIESDAVQYCLDGGLKAQFTEANEHLSGIPDESLDGIFLSQVIEHLTPAELITLIGNAYAKLKTGSTIIVETPNPQCLLIFASFFYADLSHIQPIHPETTRFLLLSAGFSDVKIKFINPVPRKERLSRVMPPDVKGNETWVTELNNNMEKLNTVLFGNMDYVVTAKK